MRVRRIIFCLTTFVFIFALFSFFTLANEATNKEKIRDDMNALTYTQKNDLEEKIAAAEQSCDTEFRIFIYNYSTDRVRYDIQTYERKVEEKFDNLVLLIISYEYGEYYYELFTKGEPHSDITDKEADRILDNEDVYDNIKSGNLYSGIDSFIELSEKAVSGKLRANFKSVILPMVLISLAIASVISLFVVRKYRKKLHSASYPLNKYARLNLNLETDDFINKTVTRVRVRSESSSSGRGGGVSFGGSRGRR